MTRRDPWTGEPLFEAVKVTMAVTIPITDEMLSRGSKVIFDQGGVGDNPPCHHNDDYVATVRDILQAVLAPPVSAGAALPAVSVVITPQLMAGLTQALASLGETFSSEMEAEGVAEEVVRYLLTCPKVSRVCLGGR